MTEPANDKILERVRGAYRQRRLQQPNGYWRCSNCDNAETFEREVICWRCGNGEMNYVAR